jgi:Peptidase family S49
MHRYTLSHAYRLFGLVMLWRLYHTAAESVQVWSLGKYKTAAEPVTRTGMSEPQREQLSALLDDVYETFLTGVAKVRAAGPL